MQREDVPGGRPCPVPAAHTCKTDFLSTTVSQDVGCSSLPCKHLDTQLPLLQRYYWFWALAFKDWVFACMSIPTVSGVTRSEVWCMSMPLWGNMVWREDGFFRPVLTGVGQPLADEQGPVKKVSKVWPAVRCSDLVNLAKKPSVSQ